MVYDSSFRFLGAFYSILCEIKDCFRRNVLVKQDQVKVEKPKI